MAHNSITGIREATAARRYAITMPRADYAAAAADAVTSPFRYFHYVILLLRASARLITTPLMLTLRAAAPQLLSVTLLMLPLPRWLWLDVDAYAPIRARASRGAMPRLLPRLCAAPQYAYARTGCLLLLFMMRAFAAVVAILFAFRVADTL